MYQDNDVGLELPIGYVREHCTAWQQLCKELDLEPDGLDRSIYLPSDRVSLDLAQAKRYGLCQEWWLSARRAGWQVGANRVSDYSRVVFC